MSNFPTEKENFQIHYQKNDNETLFKTFEKELQVYNIQNYIPLYTRYFNLNESNYEKINLNHYNTILDIEKKETDNIFNVKLKNEKKEHLRKSFFKFSPLFDPVKFMVGKYSHIDKEKMIKLPKLQVNTGYTKKVLDINNTSYVDSFFSYLTSILLNEHKFINGLDFYGSFLCIQKKHFLNIYDDLEYLYGSKYFHNNKNELFEAEDIDENMLEDDTRSHRKKLKLSNDNIDLKAENLNENMFEDIFELTEENLKTRDGDNLELCEFNPKIKKSNESSDSKKTNSTCSSRTSNTDDSGRDEDLTDGEEDEDSETENKDSELNSCTNSDMSDYSSANDKEYIKANIYDFPVQVICLEGLDNTLDSLLEVDEKDEMEDDEWVSCLFQIIMSLIVYQKCFGFTHNDLHSNNIMYTKTDKTYLIYKYEKRYYKVPTFGRIYKIIDFGRAIYKHDGKNFCCDAFSSKGDASSQYNFEPYLNENKPRLEPNPSFDLCRLACSLFDYFYDDIDEVKEIDEQDDPIASLISEWCKDDKGRNMLYKTNGEERYPEFKLYKMIARTVHNHVPSKVINHWLFKKLIVNKKKVKKSKYMNIDTLPVYT
jgi:hypothetical protein